MWQVSGGSRLFGRAHPATWHVSPHTPPDLELGAMSPMSYSTSEPSDVSEMAPSVRSPSPQLLPTRSLVDNSLRPSEAGYCTPTVSPHNPQPLVHLLRRDLEVARQEQARISKAAATYRTQALGVVRLLGTYDIETLYPPLAALQRTLVASVQAGAAPRYWFLTPTCVWGAEGLGVLAPPPDRAPDGYLPLDARALGLGCIDDTAAFMGRLAANLNQLVAHHSALGAEAVLAQLLTPLHARDTVLTLSAPVGDAEAGWPWAQATTQALWIGLVVGCAGFTPRGGAAAGLGTIAYHYVHTAFAREQAITNAWKALVTHDDDEGYGSAIARTYTGQSTSAAGDMPEGSAPATSPGHASPGGARS